MSDASGLRYEQIVSAFSTAPALPPLLTFTARDGAALDYRRYGSGAPLDLILVHGSSGHSFWMCRIAEAIAASGAANVFTPDVRGHGVKPQRRGDIDYIEQLEDDLADFIVQLKTESGARPVLVGGHSSGGGLAIRFAGGRHGYLAAGYLLLAPYLGYRASATRPNSGGWARPRLGRIVALSVLTGFGVTRFNGAPVLDFNLPQQYRTGIETTSYSFRLMTGFNPVDYRREIRAMKVPLCVLVAGDDEAFRAAEMEASIKAVKPDAVVRAIAGTSHLGIIVSEPAAAAAADWLREFQRVRSAQTAVSR